MPVLSAPSTPTHTLPGTSFTSLATPSRGSAETSVWRVAIAPGTPPTPHRLHAEEIFVVLSGRARVRFGDEDASFAEAGDAIVVPVGREFELSNAGPTTMEALCCMRVGGQAQLPGSEPFTPPWAL